MYGADGKRTGAYQLTGERERVIAHFRTSVEIGANCVGDLFKLVHVLFFRRVGRLQMTEEIIGKRIPAGNFNFSEGGFVAGKVFSERAQE